MRKICGKCSEEYEPDEHVLARFSTLPDGMKHVRGAGCDECDGTGYHGQTGVFELMTFDSRLRLAVSRGANLALGEELDWFDFPRMYDDAVEKAARGITTVEEVLRAVPFRDEEALRKRRA